PEPQRLDAAVDQPVERDGEAMLDPLVDHERDRARRAPRADQWQTLQGDGGERADAVRQLVHHPLSEVDAPAAQTGGHADAAAPTLESLGDEPSDRRLASGERDNGRRQLVQADGDAPAEVIWQLVLSDAPCVRALLVGVVLPLAPAVVVSGELAVAAIVARQPGGDGAVGCATECQRQRVEIELAHPEKVWAHARIL